MKKRKFVAILALVAALIFSACATHIDSYYNLSSTHEKQITQEGFFLTEAAMADTPNITEKYSWENIFTGAGNFIGSCDEGTGGDMSDWYHLPFGGHQFNTIPTSFIRHIGEDAFYAWKNQFDSFGGDRDWREIGLLSFVQDLNISFEELTGMIEMLHGRPMSEINALVIWARSIDAPYDSPYADTLGASFWMHQHSLAHVEALFSNDVNALWEVFPGSGVLHNNRVYTPEWIFQNTERAIFGEHIPLDAIDNILNNASLYTTIRRDDFWTLFPDAHAANTTLQSAAAALNAFPQSIYMLNFDLGRIEFAAASASVPDTIPASIPQAAISPWNGIIDTLVSSHMGFPIEGPTRDGYTFMGWYLDPNFTVYVTDCFLMPARNATMYARWEVAAPSPTPSPSPSPTPSPTPLPSHITPTLSFDMGQCMWWANSNHAANNEMLTSIPWLEISPISIPAGSNIFEYIINDPNFHIPHWPNHILVAFHVGSHQGEMLDETTIMPQADLTLYARWQAELAGVPIFPVIGGLEPIYMEGDVKPEFESELELDEQYSYDEL